MIIYELNSIKESVKANLPFETTNVGKLLRSKVTLLLLKALGINIRPEYLTILTATELIHNASLLHDDILDNEKERREDATINETKGSKISLLYGNIVLINGLKLLSNLNTDIIKIFNETINSMCKGELIQQEQLWKTPTLEEYEEKTRLKTAELFSAPLKAISTTEKLPKGLLEFTQNFGTAFQIKNDLDNILTTNSDYKQGIFTAPYILDSELKNGIEKTLYLIDNYIKESMKNLSVVPDNDYKKELIGVVECLKKSKICTTISG